MKKLLLIALLMIPATAMAQTAPVKAPNAAVTAQKGEKFEEHKAKITQKITARIAELQQKQSCIQGAATPDALKACLPHAGEHHGGKGCATP